MNINFIYFYNIALLYYNRMSSGLSYLPPLSNNAVFNISNFNYQDDPALLNNAVTLTGTQTINGTKTLTSAFVLTAGETIGQNLHVIGNTQCDSNITINGNETVLGYTTANTFIPSNSQIASAGGTTTLTATSPQNIDITGTNSQTIQMPVVTTCIQGQYWFIKNLSTGSITVNTSGGVNLATLASNGGNGDYGWFYVFNTAGGTGIASWVPIVASVNATGSSIALRTSGNVLQAGTFSGAEFQSTSTQVATFGVVRLSKGDAIAWRNNANTANLALSINSSDNITWINQIIPASISFSSTSGIIGSTTNDSAASGSVGEYIEGNVVMGSTTALTTNTAINLITISLTAGDWDVEGTLGLTSASGTVITSYAAAISTTSATLQLFSYINGTVQPASALISVGLPRKRISIASTTNVFLVVDAVFTTSTLGCWGELTARRIR